MVGRHRIQGLACAALSGNTAVPDETKRSLAVLAQKLAFDALSMTREAFLLDQAFAEAGVPVAFIKGPVLAQLIHGTVGQRQCKDLDLVVPVEALPVAGRLLTERGYHRTMPPATLRPHFEPRWIREYKDFQYYHPRSGIQVELHWRLFDNRYLMPVPPPERWVKVAFGPGSHLKSFSQEDLLLYLCLHGAATAWFRMKWLADIDSLIAQDAEALRRLVAVARDKGVLRPVAQGLFLCQQLFGTELPDDIVRGLPRNGVVKRLMVIALRLLTSNKIDGNFAAIPFATTQIALGRFLLKSDWHYRIAEMRLGLISREDWRMVPLPPAFAFLFPFLRLPLWAVRKVRKVVTAGWIK